MREKAIEAYLRGEVKKLGGKAYKFVSPGNAGVPDRLVLLPEGITVFVELKAPGKKSTKLQLKKQKELTGLGHVVFKDVDSKEKINAIIAYCKGWIGLRAFTNQRKE